MTTFLLILTMIVSLALIGVILLQRSEGGGLGGMGGGGGAGSFMTGRGTTNLLTHSTAVLAGLFMVLCLGLGIMDKGAAGGGGHDILSTKSLTQAASQPGTGKGATQPAPAPQAPQPAQPAR
ncbi:preprotein translocase subunit SecG [Formicincola oecophyllae]|uniref:Protein-export membrane protein SecG n=1 Tax=Formicincola oecophyllae TaxID=2558361 RepID=A0A4Y6UBY6_9PROT|nr:preprotein translocase subunit SecG [Formicincola oecophyllae]QDH13986.1 preprotein translocase subunit SecG [Formicincola oecophyllae]